MKRRKKDKLCVTITVTCKTNCSGASQCTYAVILISSRKMSVPVHVMAPAQKEKNKPKHMPEL